MAKVSTYKLEAYDGGLAPRPTPTREGVFQLSDAEWRLIFRDSHPGVACGLLRSRVDVEKVGRRRCRVTINDDQASAFRSSFLVRTRADHLRSDLRKRISMLERSGAAVAAVDEGQWWRDVRVFDSLGWSRTISIAGVRNKDGRWGTSRIKRSRLARLMDFGPKGVSLRGWRTRLVFPWDSIAAIDVTDGRDPGSGGRAERVSRSRHEFSGTTVLLRSHTAQEVAFHTWLSTPSTVRSQLSLFVERLIRATESQPRPPLPSATGHHIEPAEVPELPPV
jgi:hypothetical protein